jgi:hypothetical protein
MSNPKTTGSGPDCKEYEVVVGFAGGSRTVVEVVEAREGHGRTAVAQEIHEL